MTSIEGDPMSAQPKIGRSREQLFEECRTLFNRITPAAIGIAGCVLVAIFALRAPISRDSAYAVQWAYSIGTSFKWQMTEVPHDVYPAVLSNGGPLMYAGGLGYALTHSVDGAIAFGTVAGFAMLVVGLMLTAPWLSCVAVASLFVWPIFGYMSTAFLAEFWATGLTLTGLWLFARAQSTPSVAKLFADRRTWFAFFLFSLGTWSKVIASLAIFGVIFATVFAREQPRSVLGAVLNGLRALAVTAISCAIIGILFFLEFGFAVVHTLRSVQGALTVPLLFHQLIDGMTGLASNGPQAITFVGQFDKYSNQHLIIVIIAAAVILVLSKPSYSLLVFFAAMLWLHFGMDERETLPVFLTILALGLRETYHRLAPVAQRLPAIPVRAIVFVAILTFTIMIPHIGPPKANPYGLTVTYIGPPAADPYRRYGTDLYNNGYIHYSRQMVQDLQAHKYVFIHGVDALPQIDTSWGLTFYDRIAPSNAYLWNQDNVLLFDTAQPSVSIADNCSSVIRIEGRGELVLCRARKDVPLDYVAFTMPPGQRRTVDLSKRPWTTAAGFHRTSDGPHGSSWYRFVGPNVFNGDSRAAVSLDVPVQPGAAYVFSAWVDPSKLTVAGTAGFTLMITDASGKYNYYLWWPIGPPGRYSLHPWVCPPGIHHVFLAMGRTAPIVLDDQAITFSEPALTEIRDAPSPTAGKGSS